MKLGYPPKESTGRFDEVVWFGRGFGSRVKKTLLSLLTPS